MWLHKHIQRFQHGGIFTTGAKCVLNGSSPVSAISCKVIMEYGGSWSLKHSRVGRVGGFVTQSSECRTDKAVTTLMVSRENLFTLIITNKQFTPVCIWDHRDGWKDGGKLL